MSFEYKVWCNTLGSVRYMLRDMPDDALLRFVVIESPEQASISPQDPDYELIAYDAMAWKLDGSDVDEDTPPGIVDVYLRYRRAS